MGIPWDQQAAGVVVLPSGLRVRGRALRRPPPPGPEPELGLYLSTCPAPAELWDTRWLRWPDFRPPSSTADAAAALRDVHQQLAVHRVEIGCRGGTGRTGTALACLAVLDGLAPDEAVHWVRSVYRRRAVETPGQRRFVLAFGELESR